MCFSGQAKKGFPDSGVAPPQGCPPGLEYLAQMEEIYVNQKVDLLESRFMHQLC